MKIDYWNIPGEKIQHSLVLLVISTFQARTNTSRAEYTKSAK